MKIEEHIGWADMMVYTHECPKCGTESDVHIGEDAKKVLLEEMDDAIKRLKGKEAKEAAE